MADLHNKNMKRFLRLKQTHNCRCWGESQQIEQELKRQNQYLDILAKITLKIRQSVQLNELLQSTVKEVRELLVADRVLVYRFWNNGNSSVITEADKANLPCILGKAFPDSFLSIQDEQLYFQGQVKIINDVEKYDYSSDLQNFLQQFYIKSQIVVPILINQDIWGLFIVHQSQVRNWLDYEIELLKQITEHLAIGIVQAQFIETIKLNEKRYTRILGAAKDGLWDWNLKTNYVHFYPSWKAILGYAEEEIGSTIEEWFNRIHPHSLEQVKTEINAYLAGHISEFESEHRVLHRDGVYRWMRVRAVGQKDAEGKIDQIVGAFTDITKRKLAEERLRLLESVVINANDAVLIAEAEPIDYPGPRILYANAAFTAMTGYSLEEILGKTPRILQGPKTDKAALAKIRAALKAWQSVRVEIINYAKDGSEFWVELNIAPVADQTGWYTHWISIQRDITDRKRTELVWQRQTERERLVAQMAQRIRESLSLDDILNTTVSEVRQFLDCDRVLIYRLWHDGTGSTVKESVAAGRTSILGRSFSAEVFPQEYHQLYREGRIRAIADVDTDVATPCHVEFMRSLHIRAKLVVAIVQGEKLWGLLIAHQCYESRQWQLLEISLLSSLAMQLAISIQQSELYQQLQSANQELRCLATSDSLTQIANRRCFDDFMEQQWQRLADERKYISLILCDIDCFKLYNDTYGHQGGDHCLQEVARAITRAVKRPTDLVARYGGEEFAIILPYTNMSGAMVVAQEIRSYVNSLGISHASSTVTNHVTMSLGVASTIPSPNSSIPMLIAMADEALYQAKKQGRNQVAAFG